MPVCIVFGREPALSSILVQTPEHAVEIVGTLAICGVQAKIIEQRAESVALDGRVSVTANEDAALNYAPPPHEQRSAGPVPFETDPEAPNCLWFS